jgi:hypothetical protein
VAGVVDDLPADNVRDAFPVAVDEVESQRNEHLRWIQDMRRRMVSLEPTSHHQRGGVSGCDPPLAAVVDQTRDASVSSSAHHPYQARNRPRPPARARHRIARIGSRRRARRSCGLGVPPTLPALLEMTHCIEGSEALDDPANVVERPAAAVAPAGRVLAHGDRRGGVISAAMA